MDVGWAIFTVLDLMLSSYCDTTLVSRVLSAQVASLSIIRQICQYFFDNVTAKVARSTAVIGPPL